MSEANSTAPRVFVSLDMQLPSIWILPVTLAEGYRVSARELHAGLKSLASRPPDNLMARALLAGFTVEAALKSFLATRLRDPEVLR